MQDLKIHEEIIRLSRAGQSYALATVIETSGSSPRKAGAKMLVRNDGTILGSVGGGRVEAETVAACVEVARSGGNRVLSYTLTEEQGFVCGGKISIYIEGVLPSRRLVVFGAGHVGKAVASLAATAGFSVTVVDSRPEWANSENLPSVDRIVCSDEVESIGDLELDADTLVIVATIGHELDYKVARGVLSSPVQYLGVLGSNRKARVLTERLLGDGFTTGDIGRLVTPVGFPIGAETPAEIAVSIVAQLIGVRRNNGSARFSYSPGSRPVAADGDLQAASPA